MVAPGGCGVRRSWVTATGCRGFSPTRSAPSQARVGGRCTPCHPSVPALAPPVPHSADTRTAEPARRVPATQAGRNPSCRPRPDQPRDRRSPVRLATYGGQPPARHLPSARHQGTPRARRPGCRPPPRRPGSAREHLRRTDSGTWASRPAEPLLTHIFDPGYSTGPLAPRMDRGSARRTEGDPARDGVRSLNLRDPLEDPITSDWFGQELAFGGRG